MILEILKLTKSFGGLRAVNEVDLNVRKGTIHAIIGPNGAGKTTLFNCITALESIDSGKIAFDGENIEDLPTHRISAKGIGRTFQNIRLFPFMTVLENVKVGTHNLTNALLWSVLTRNKLFKREEKKIDEFAKYLLNKVDLYEKKDLFANNLPYGEQRRLEIVRALASKPKLLLLDEPAAGMNIKETNELDKFINQIKEDGLTILLIEHDMKLVMNISDMISVFDHGKKIAEGAADSIQNNEQVIEAYLGKKRED